MQDLFRAVLTLLPDPPLAVARAVSLDGISHKESVASNEAIRGVANSLDGKHLTSSLFLGWSVHHRLIPARPVLRRMQRRGYNRMRMRIGRGSLVAYEKQWCLREG